MHFEANKELSSIALLEVLLLQEINFYIHLLLTTSDTDNLQLQARLGLFYCYINHHTMGVCYQKAGVFKNHINSHGPQFSLMSSHSKRSWSNHKVTFELNMGQFRQEQTFLMKCRDYK